MNIVASNLLAKREEKRFTQAHMAFLSGMSQPNYSDIERGKTRPSIDQLKIFSEILGTSVDDLISDPKQNPRFQPTAIKDGSNLEQSALLKSIENKDKYIKLLEDQLDECRKKGE
jgi:transcriptional regulator with XRE-family HTH domain